MDKKKLYDLIDSRAEEFINVSDRIWEFAELSLNEYQSAKLYCDYLRAEGFTVEESVAGVATAFTGAYGSGKPVIGILGEYDALSSLSQKPGVAFREEEVPGGGWHERIYPGDLSKHRGDGALFFA